ncbi:Thrombospondin, type 1 repeat-containing protein [Strongyloides ratti]|uniref:Thrombospondin, type 1 repeat-containing protein n=1 Tax=Strongyloides ratti TaxID=34506 RepID=A0A090L4J0_STRRB|nr:Thrombospondin, type 1 repeat-containing protein [Strongyloides ratti]CEF62414.1 Thrombospondin, type 1 repeat-containing protein [Strongyloides ratti]
MKFFIITTIILISGLYSNGDKINPLKAEIYKDNFHSLNVGSGDRIIFQLDRPYQPLSPAGMIQDKGDIQNKIHFNPDYKPRILATKNTVTFAVEPSIKTIQVNSNVNNNENIEKNLPEDITVSDDKQPTASRWLSWSQWSSCISGERTRIRACKRQGIEPCFGTNIQTEKCVTIKTPTKVAMATDPWSIEKEISHRTD